MAKLARQLVVVIALGAICPLLILLMGKYSPTAERKENERSLLADVTALRPRPNRSMPLPTQEEVDASPMVLVQSPGGVGTTSFMLDMAEPLKAAGLRLNHVHDHDWLKHSRVKGALTRLCRQAEQAAGCPHQLHTVVYLFGEPVHAVLSLFRRGFFGRQLRKLRNKIDHCQYVTVGGTPLHMSGLELLNLTPGNYADLQTDILGFSQHLADWFLFACSPGAQHTSIFIRREQLWRHMPALAYYLNISLASMNTRAMLPFTGSHHLLEASLLSPAQLVNLQHTYRPLVDLYATLGEFTVLNQTSCASESLTRLRSWLEAPSCPIRPYSPNHCDLG